MPPEQEAGQQEHRDHRERCSLPGIRRSSGFAATDDRPGVAPVRPAQTFVIDYSSPNVAKPMHVGHLRSTIIGDALTRLLRFLGHTVVTANHPLHWCAQLGIPLY